MRRATRRAVRCSDWTCRFRFRTTEADYEKGLAYWQEDYEQAGAPYGPAREDFLRWFDELAEGLHRHIQEARTEREAGQEKAGREAWSWRQESRPDLRRSGGSAKTTEKPRLPDHFPPNPALHRMILTDS